MYDSGLTNTTAKIACLLYAEYRSRVKSRLKTNTSMFGDVLSYTSFRDCTEYDVLRALNELKDVFGLKTFPDGSFELSANFKEYMAKKTKLEITVMLQLAGTSDTMVDYVTSLIF